MLIDYFPACRVQKIKYAEKFIRNRGCDTMNRRKSRFLRDRVGPGDFSTDHLTINTVIERSQIERYTYGSGQAGITRIQPLNFDAL